jgi:hypothetical protein
MKCDLIEHIEIPLRKVKGEAERSNNTQRGKQQSEPTAKTNKKMEQMNREKMCRLYKPPLRGLRPASSQTPNQQRQGRRRLEQTYLFI